ncbi:MAG: hypothetical protein A2X57_11930 [Nitrospirae bacterium GWD2_57_8]|nr:MAG: hypothetical protein A2X57_11930 [Nitrospirae bacterium GWD2_57_8]
MRVVRKFLYPVDSLDHSGFDHYPGRTHFPVLEGINVIVGRKIVERQSSDIVFATTAGACLGIALTQKFIHNGHDPFIICILNFEIHG